MHNSKTICTFVENKQYKNQMDITKILNACEETQSTLTKTGRFYKLNGKVIVEYMKSSRNVWVDADISALISSDERKEVEKQIRTFFYDRVNNVNFGLEINKDINDFNNKLTALLSTIENPNDRKQAEIMSEIFKK